VWKHSKVEVPSCVTNMECLPLKVDKLYLRGGLNHRDVLIDSGSLILVVESLEKRQ